jgi:hypothetical protein
MNTRMPAAAWLVVALGAFAPSVAQADLLNLPGNSNSVTICVPQDWCTATDELPPPPESDEAVPAPAAPMSSAPAPADSAGSHPAPVVARPVASTSRSVRQAANRRLHKRYAGWKRARKNRTATLRCAPSAGSSWRCLAVWRSGGKLRARTLTVTRYRISDRRTRMETSIRRA